jgi:hypothetical protein
MSGWLTDESDNNFTATAYSWGANGVAPTFSTDQKKFGTSSAYFSRYGNDQGGCIRLPDDNAFTLSTTFTIDWWMKQINSGVHMGVYAQNTDENGVRIMLSDVRKLYTEFWMTSGSVGPGSDPYTYSNNAWTHVAIVRNAAAQNWKVYRDGTQVASYGWASPWNGTLSNIAATPAIGIGGYSSNPGYSYPFNGYIDAFRITDGEALWTQNFDHNALTQPVATSNTVLLMNFNETFYQVQGTLSDQARVIVIDEDTRTVEYDDIKSAGAYAIDVYDNSVKFVAAERLSDGKSLAYGQVIPTQI